MTQSELKELTNLGAELGAAKAEVERLREALETCESWFTKHSPTAPLIGGFGDAEHPMITFIRAALSQQAEPADTFTAVDMATAAAQGFRDGLAAVKPAPAQDELWAVHAQGPDELYAAFSREDAEQHAAALNALPMPAGIQVSAVVIASPWSAAEHWKYLAEQEREHAAELKDRAAQTEQQPVEVMRFQLKHPDTGDAHAVALTRQEVADGMEDTLYEKLGDLICHCEPVGETNVVDCNCDEYIYEFELVNAAPIAQTAPQGKLRMGDLVRKTSGSEWEGHICGTYSTELTPEGYAVESAAHKGSVQIYPAKALEAV
jgi:hypothetical protein